MPMQERDSLASPIEHGNKTARFDAKAGLHIPLGKQNGHRADHLQSNPPSHCRVTSSQQCACVPDCIVRIRACGYSRSAMAPSLRSFGRSPLTSDRQGFDRRWYASQLQEVFVPTSLEAVALALSEAITRYGSGVKVASGRHCYENFVYNSTTAAVVDLSGLNQVGYDHERQLFFVDAGCENWTIYRTLLNGHGKTLPAGSCYSVGAGGHISGGGYGLLSRLHGLTVDHLHAMDIAIWDPQRREARLYHVSVLSDDPDERDLFWALCGAGGGNFGVIVRYYFADLPDAPSHASLTVLAWNWSDLPLNSFQAFMAEYSDLMLMLPEPCFTLLKLNHHAAGQLALVLQVVSQPGQEIDDHRRQVERHLDGLRSRFNAIAPATDLLTPLVGHLGRMHALPASQDAQHLTYLEALQTLNGSGPNQFGKYKSAYMNKAFPADQVEAIHHYLQVVPKGLRPDDMKQSLVQVDSYGGAVNRVAADATAVPQRSAIMKLQYQTYWTNNSAPGDSGGMPYRQQEEAHVDWLNQMYTAVYHAYGGTPDPASDPSGTVAGCYYNYPDIALGTHADGRIDQALWLYFLNNYRRSPRNLVAVKRRWDPANLFHHAQSLPLL